VARTIWGEARNQGQSGMEAVASVIMNRSRKSPAYKWPRSPAAVCRQAYQFSCWNANDPNLPRLKAVTTSDAQFRTCIAIAQKAVAGKLADRTMGSDHYYAESIATPKWAVGKMPMAKYGSHLFFNLVG
jgi:N-acetylmuramoyl-L-alanine amidase